MRTMTSQRRKLVDRALRLERVADAIRDRHGIHWKVDGRLYQYGKAGVLVAKLKDKADAIRDAIRETDYLDQKALAAKADRLAKSVRRQLDNNRSRATTANGQRKALSKRTRWEVLHRCGFTCQDCGRKAPEVVLHVDHRKSVKSGGDNAPWNLVALCSECNLGKGAKSVVPQGRAEAQ